MLKKDKTEKALSTFLRPEFINRIDEIITFRHLDKSDFEKIADIMLSKLAAHMDEKGIRLTYSDEVLTYIANESYSEKYGARNMRRYIQTTVEDAVAEKIVALRGRVTAISVDAEGDELKVTAV